MSLTAKLTMALIAELTSEQDLATGRAPLSWAETFSLTDGSGTNEANRIFHDERTIAASSNDDIDLAGVLIDIFGATLTLARVKVMIVKSDIGNANTLAVGAAASNTWVGPFGGATHTTVVRPGGLHVSVAPDATGWPVTAGTGDQLRIANGGAGSSVTYKIGLIGVGA
jgi:hypothetical protein